MVISAAIKWFSQQVLSAMLYLQSTQVFTSYNNEFRRAETWIF